MRKKKKVTMMMMSRLFFERDVKQLKLKLGRNKSGVGWILKVVTNHNLRYHFILCLGDIFSCKIGGSFRCCEEWT